MKPIFKSIGILITLLFMVALLVARIETLFPTMDAMSWVFIAVGFGACVLLAIRLEEWIENFLPGRFNEDQRLWIAIIAIFIFSGITIYFGWNYIGPYFSPHFGAAVR